MFIKTTMIFLLLTIKSYASEIDNFTDRYEQSISDSLEKINQAANSEMENAVNEANGSFKGCNERELYKHLRKKFNNHYIGKFTKYVYLSKELERIITPISQSIYQDFTPEESIVLGGVGKYIRDPLGSVVKVHDVLVGTDKFEHFAGTGFVYFKQHHLEKKPIQNTLAIGQRDENGYLGALSTGVVSYGDMTAEFNGMRFWNHILGKDKDILNENLGPYIECKNNLWTIVKEVDLGKYIDQAWDEAYNCSKFRTNKMVEKVRNRLNELEDKSHLNFNCPLDSKKITETMKKYGQFGAIIINPNGHQKK